MLRFPLDGCLRRCQARSAIVGERRLGSAASTWKSVLIAIHVCQHIVSFLGYVKHNAAPDGMESNQAMGASSTAHSIRVCSSRAAMSPAEANENART